MLITLKSTNPKMSWVIQKNPESIPSGRLIRQGVGIGYFVDDTTYKLVFLDGWDEVSYPDYPDEFAYLQPNELVHPQAALNLLSEFMQTATTKNNEHDDSATQEVIIESLLVRDKTIKTFNEYFQNFRIIHEPLNWPEYKKISIQHTGKLKDTLMYTNVFLLMALLDNHLWFDRSSDLTNKYAKMLVELDVPYFIRYIFKYHLLRSQKEFNKYKPMLETSDINHYEFCYGSNQTCRENWVTKQLKSKTVIDIGCGEGRYFRYANKVDAWYGVDIDPEVLQEATYQAKKYDNVEVFGNIKNVPNVDECDIILTEVLEHIELEELIIFLKDVKNKFQWQQIIITTPNSCFNQFYNLDNEFRHQDHKWEKSPQEVYDLLKGIFNEPVELFNVGDIVNGEATTIGIVIRQIE